MVVCINKLRIIDWLILIEIQHLTMCYHGCFFAQISDTVDKKKTEMGSNIAEWHKGFIC